MTKKDKMVDLDLTEHTIKTITTDVEYLNIENHAHPHHHQLIYSLKGTLRIALENDDFFLPEGHIAVIPAGFYHRLESKNIRVKMFLLYFPKYVDQRFKILNTNDFILETIRYISKQKQTVTILGDQGLFNFILAFLDLPDLAKGHELKLKGLLSPKNERLRAVLQYINQNYMLELKLPEVAGLFGFTERNLSRTFKSENLSFNNYLNYQRIIRSIELMSDNKDNIEQISYEIGYNTLSNFSRTFKKFTGASPTNYIKANQTRRVGKDKA